MHPHLFFGLVILITLAVALPPLSMAQQNVRGAAADEQAVRQEHETIGIAPGDETTAPPSRTTHPDAQWFPDAAFGLFLHWSICSVREMNISWPMIPGRPLADTRIEDPAERERIIREGDWNLNGRPPQITPLEYWEMAKGFNPADYDPDKWMKAAKEAGFTYVVLTAKHHDGFALWPSAYGNFNTKNHMGGRDLIRPYVEACRRHGLKVGLYYSGPDWYFDQDYHSFLYGGARRLNPEFPSLGPDLKPRTNPPDPEARARHQAEYAAMVKGQIEELLTNYGQIDVLWFDGRPGVPNASQVITLERIRELQPGIVVNPRLHGSADYITFERRLHTDQVQDGWAEFCNTWTNNWSHVPQRFRANGFVLGQLALSRSLAVNYLLGVGPMANGDMHEDVYANMAAVAEWMNVNGESIRGTRPLPDGEAASVPATAEGNRRYLFLIPQFRNNRPYEQDQLPPEDETINLTGAARPMKVSLLDGGMLLDHEHADGTTTIHIPADRRTKLVDVVLVELTAE